MTNLTIFRWSQVKKIVLLSCSLCLLLFVKLSAQTISLSSLLEEMSNRDTMAR